MLAETPAIAQQGCRPMQWSQADLRRISHVPFPMGEQRRVVALLSCSQDLVISVAADRDLSARRLNAALAAFAFRNPNLTAAQLPGAIAALAGEIETLNDLLETANERIATLENAALRRSAQAELIHIQSLLDAGDLVGVVAAFTELRTLQSRVSRDAQADWDAVIEAEAQFYFLQGDTEQADQLELEGVALRNLANQRSNWFAHLRRSERRSVRGLFFGIVSQLREAVRILESDALPLVHQPTPASRSTDNATSDWADTQMRLCSAKKRLAFAERNLTLMAESAGHCEEALRTYPGTPAFLINLADTKLELYRLGGGVEDFEHASRIYRTLLRVTTDIRLRTQLYTSLSDAFVARYEVDDDDRQLEQAVRYAELALEGVSQDDQQQTWANAQTSLAQSKLSLGELRSDIDMLMGAVAAAERAQSFYTQGFAPQFWLQNQRFRALAIYMAGDVSSDVTLLNQAKTCFEEYFEFLGESEEGVMQQAYEHALSRIIELQ